MSACCPCDDVELLPEVVIAAGLEQLPRQALGFPEYRRALLHALRQAPALAALRAREGDDFGLLLIESWAVVLDVVGFYDMQIAQDLYLRTARDAAALQRLVALIGYRPRPAMAAEAWLAAIAERGPDVLVPAGTAFRSEAFGSEPPQVFESDAERRLNARTNRWLLAPLAPATAAAATAADEPLLLDLRTVRLVRGQWAVFSGLPGTQAARVLELQPVKAVDGVLYAQARVQPAVAPAEGTALADVRVRMPTATARLNRLVATPVSGATLLLDAIYPQIQPGDEVLLAADGQATVLAVTQAVPVAVVPLESTGLGPSSATQLSFGAALAAPWSTAAALAVHFQFIEAGSLRRPARLSLQRADLLPRAALAGPSVPLDASAPGPLLLRDAEKTGARVEGLVDVDTQGQGTLTPASDDTPFARPLVPPVEVFANLVHVVRGETVAHEVLGSGDAAVAWPSFALRRKPLSYVPDEAAPGGRRAALEVRVNGVLWREIDSFYGSGEHDPVYTVRLDAQQNARVNFRRLPSGVDNVVARYRFGAGKAKPPPGGITQIVRPVKGLARVLDPVGASGGADAERPRDLRTGAPASALTLGRAISLDDFEALARSFPGILNVAARWAWDAGQQRAVVMLWFIADGGDPAPKLRAYLRGQSDPAVPLVAAAAQPVDARLVVDFIAAEGHVHADVEARLIAALADPDDGYLAPGRVPVGGPIFRSALTAVVAGVPGLKAVRRLSVDGADMPVALVAREGEYLRFLPFSNR